MTIRKGPGRLHACMAGVVISSGTVVITPELGRGAQCAQVCVSEPIEGAGSGRKKAGKIISAIINPRYCRLPAHRCSIAWSKVQVHVSIGATVQGPGLSRSGEGSKGGGSLRQPKAGQFCTQAKMEACSAGEGRWEGSWWLFSLLAASCWHPRNGRRSAAARYQ